MFEKNIDLKFHEKCFFGNNLSENGGRKKNN